MTDDPGPKEELERDREELLDALEAVLETTMFALGLAWLVLLVVELVWGLSPLLEGAITTIWIIFIADFAIRFVVAPHKPAYLRRNWLTALSLLLPAARVLRVARFARFFRLGRAARGLRLVKVVGSLNRGMRALRGTMTRRGFGYVAALTTVVTLVGAAGMHAFERETGDPRGLTSYGNALWWTAMIMTTVGSEYWPVTPEGRILCFFLSLYALGILGYVAATLSSFFVGRDATSGEAERPGEAQLEALRLEIRLLRDELRTNPGAREEGERVGEE